MRRVLDGLVRVSRCAGTYPAVSTATASHAETGMEFPGCAKRLRAWLGAGRSLRAGFVTEALLRSAAETSVTKQT